MSKFLIARFEDIEGVNCPCGISKRAFTEDADGIATMHLVEVTEDAKVHYHKKLTEIYFILEGSGQMELDGEVIPVRPITSIMIKPGCRHRALGKMKIVNVAIPAFDPDDEWFD